MSLKSDLKAAFMGAYGSSELSSANHPDISDKMALAMTNAIFTCIESPNTINTTYAGVTSAPTGVGAVAVGVGSFSASAGKSAFQTGLFGLLMDIGAGQTFHSNFASLLSAWYVTCIPTDLYTGTTVPPLSPPVPLSGSGIGTTSVLSSATDALATSMFIPQSFFPSDEDAGNDYVSDVWASAIITFLEAGVVMMTGAPVNAGLAGAPATLTNFV